MKLNNRRKMIYEHIDPAQQISRLKHILVSRFKPTYT